MYTESCLPDGDLDAEIHDTNTGIMFPTSSGALLYERSLFSSVGRWELRWKEFETRYPDELYLKVRGLCEEKHNEQNHVERDLSATSSSALVHWGSSIDQSNLRVNMKRGCYVRAFHPN